MDILREVKVMQESGRIIFSSIIVVSETLAWNKMLFLHCLSAAYVRFQACSHKLKM